MKVHFSPVFIFGALALLLFASCELLEGIEPDNEPDIAGGLREALKIGTDTATARLAAVDGYLKDEAVKILLPDELEEQITNFKAIEIDVFGIATFTGQQIYESGIPGFTNSLQSIEDELIEGVNRAAESAATEAGPIFFNAITDITITDANNILFGANDAATVYLKDNTYESLFSTYEPKINQAISKVSVGEKTVEEAYANFVNSYNNVLNTQLPTGLFSRASIAELANLNIIEAADLSSFATNKGLDGLFLKIEEEEGHIRENPLNRVTDILKEVFGLLD